jgi:hypothetical protein
LSEEFSDGDQKVETIRQDLGGLLLVTQRSANVAEEHAQRVNQTIVCNQALFLKIK